MPGDLVDAEWHCDTCGAEGTLEVLSTIKYEEVFVLMVVAHEEMSPDCTDRELLGFIKRR